MGMTVSEYWDDDCQLAKYYREAEELRNEHRNQELWLQGMYIYEAIADLIPVLHAFAKKGAKAKPYPKQPYAITRRAMKSEKAKSEKAAHDKGLRYMQALMANTKKKGENADGS